MRTIILFLLLMFCYNAFCANLECYVFVYNDKAGMSEKKLMTIAPYDKNFLEATIGNYGFGVDKFFLADTDSLTLVITNSKAHVNAASTAGWRVVSKTRMHDLVYDFALPDGSKDEAQINCYDYL